MDFKVVLVENEMSNEVLCSSGILFGKQYILVTGNILWKLLNKEIIHQIKQNVLKDCLSNINKSNPKINVKWKTGQTITMKRAKIIKVIVNEDLLNSSKSIFEDWNIDDINNKNDVNLMLSLHFILSLSEESSQLQLEQALKYWWDGSLRADIYKGINIWSLSVLFGNINFIDSQCRGIISNVVAKNDCLIVSDIPSTPGSEGSPIYSNSSDVPLGIIISSLNWWKKEWIGCTLITDIRSIIKQILYQETSIKHVNLQNFKVTISTESSLVKIKCGPSWGTGIIINKDRGLIVTNSHVLEDIDRFTCLVRFKEHQSTGKLIYKTSHEVYDIGLISCDDLRKWNVSNIKIAQIHPSIGEEIYAGGFSLFSDEFGGSPTISKGNISHVQKYMIKTTANINAGASGGCILNENGELLGIIVSNIKLPENSVYPRVNMAIPISEVKPILDLYMTHNDSGCLKKLEIDDIKIVSEWKMLKGKL
ncbi:peroxisomal leader peptide-processing protease isoform X2 [Aethina tumida]|nr:peroxisomal leader peptide-processing protease isoform X2 [Aethina tumida]XP_049821764.1 peroxisomal leader peptide-processing protease isoform X2 [Aethina tumida]XP_049821767.1 peroxisomal leader peptide-processing protease isoform X2 [Aethina tumida]